MSKKQLINAHTHSFTGSFVPPFLAKTIAPWPLYYLIHTRILIGIVKRYLAFQNRKKYPDAKDQELRNQQWERLHAGKRRERWKTKILYGITSRWFLNIPYVAIIFWLSIVAGLYAIDFLAYIFGIKEGTLSVLNSFKKWLSSVHLLFELPVWLKIFWVLFVVFFVNWSRRTILFLIKLVFPMLKKIISPNGVELAERYWQIGRYSFYGFQRNVAQRAKDQLPSGSGMVILPMDMEYMGAGKTKVTKAMMLRIMKDGKLDKDWTSEDYSDSFKYQMNELWDFVKLADGSAPKNVYYPFLFLDPRRIKEEGKAFFDYQIKEQKMVLKPCFVKRYMEDRKFSGFKIYPALGYYAFDEYLLPIWRYASENNIPIMTHCVIGVIYYRGKKKKEWNFHPVFKQFYNNIGSSEPEPMLLPEMKNVEFQYNFTHPLNYLCLVEETFLRRVVGSSEQESVKDLFGYSNSETPLKYNLNNLKICLAHYGGEEEWLRYLEADRNTYSQRLIKDPENAIQFMKNSKKEESWPKLNQLWKDVDWYSIISAMLIRYENIYADLSYIISKPSIYPLLKETLAKADNYEEEHKEYVNEASPNKKANHYSGKNKLRSRVLYGTDFYVVRNHNSDKELYVDIKAALDEESFDLIARENTHNYLSRD